MKRLGSEISNIDKKVSEFTSQHIKPIFVNHFTRLVVSWTYDHVLTPTGQAVKDFTKFFFKTLLWKGICKPLCNHVLSPVFSSIGDFFHGACSGALRNDSQPKKPQEVGTVSQPNA